MRKLLTLVCLLAIAGCAESQKIEESSPSDTQSEVTEAPPPLTDPKLDEARQALVKVCGREVKPRSPVLSETFMAVAVGRSAISINDLTEPDEIDPSLVSSLEVAIKSGDSNGIYLYSDLICGSYTN